MMVRMIVGLRHTVTFVALFLAGMLVCHAPLLADEPPWLPVSKVISELSQNPDFVEALYKRLGHDPKAGGILGPDEIKRLRELILGKNFEALDSFPGMTIPGMGRAVRLAAAAMDQSGNKAPPPPEVAQQATGAATGIPVEEELGIPAAGDPPAPDAYCGPWALDWKTATGSTRCWPSDMPIASGFPRC